MLDLRKDINKIIDERVNEILAKKENVTKVSKGFNIGNLDWVCDEIHPEIVENLFPEADLVVKYNERDDWNDRDIEHKYLFWFDDKLKTGVYAYYYMFDKCYTFGTFKATRRGKSGVEFWMSDVSIHADKVDIKKVYKEFVAEKILLGEA